MPEDLAQMLNFFNGFAEYEMFDMYRIWKLAEFKQVKATFSKSLLNDTNKTPLLNPEKYYIIGDYNVNSAYWAVLFSNELNNVICIYDLDFTYKIVEDSFSEFITILLDNNPEDLLF